MIINQYYISTDPKSKKGVSVTILKTLDVVKGKKTMGCKGYRINNEDFENPVVEKGVSGKIVCKVWTTEDNAKKFLEKGIKLIIKEYHAIQKDWIKTQEAILRMKGTLKQF